jgi:tetratricopeptide (TPR) repeat protein
VQVMAHHGGSVNNQSLRAKAETLRKSGQFEEAAAEYAQIWPDGDTWTGWGYAYCLRKLGRLQEALEVAREVYRLKSDFRYGKAIYAWILYDLYIRHAETPNQTLVKAADAIVSLTNDEQAYEATSAFVITVLGMAKLWAAYPRDLRVLEWLDKLDVDRLSTDPGKGTDQRGQERELTSRKEQYYSLKTHSLERLERWQECLEAATRALTDCGALHHDNDVWFARRIALAKQKLGHPEEAVTELERLVDRKQTGFLHTDVAAAAWDAGDKDRTFKHALQSLRAEQEIGFKLEAARLMAEVLWQRGQVEEAREHIRLCVAVRAEKGWKPADDLSSLASKWEVNGKQENAATLLQRLRLLWDRWSEEISPRMSGVITRILPNGHAGFIRGNNNVDFYFDSREWKERKLKPAAGNRVTFGTKPGFDRKRQRQTTVACDVRAASEQVSRVPQ